MGHLRYGLFRVPDKAGGDGGARETREQTYDGLSHGNGPNYVRRLLGPSVAKATLPSPSEENKIQSKVSMKKIVAFLTVTLSFGYSSVDCYPMKTVNHCEVC